MITSRTNPVRDTDFREEWSSRHWYCQACGVHARDAERAGPFGLSCHHIIKPGRSDEACNLLRLCQTCHDLAELRNVKRNGILLPKLPWPVCLTLKKTREAQEFNLARCLELMRHGPLELPPVPEEIEALFRKNRPWDKARFWIPPPPHPLPAP